ncbi:Zn-dependent hydrolase [Ensifer sp. YR511]|uniref:Zn-dependent hydrolase n=1 Tax=Ensifer sp. YR511 TaxID=1855294 RepID=UPI000884EF22|nr:Zn-dependent hydrolase [Ensifer sp. YR511]SDN80162.1 N-carbamoyl-L-amino-acid hydrolase [Ensifer sp. YR511]
MTRNLPGNLQVRADRIADDIDGLAGLTEPDKPWTRRAFTPMFLKGRHYLNRRFKEAGLETRIDAAGNLVGLRKGKAGNGTIMLGSHSDTVPNGGRFDGIAGVAAALEVARSLNDAGVQLEHDLEIVDFLAEEVSIFGVSCIGSRGMLGLRPSEWLERQVEGVTLAEGIRSVGGNPALIGSRDDIKAFLELHIEQGPVLENERIDIGVVTAISGIARIEILVEGRADHAGTTPMGLRLDALSAASHIVLGIERTATDLSRGPSHFAATVGEFVMEPNAANVVPSRVRMLIDARAIDRAVMEAFSDAVATLCVEVVSKCGVSITAPRRISDNPPSLMSEKVVALLEESTAGLSLSSRRMVSGAGHDAAYLNSAAPTAMVFIPCREGRSHTAEEWAENDDITLGAAVLYETVLKLDKE